MELHIGRRLHPGECVHHIDGNRLNNDLANLQLMDHGEHSSLHRRMSVLRDYLLDGDGGARPRNERDNAA